MDWDKIKKPAIATLITIIVGIIIYSVIGILTYAGNTVIYDKFPEEFYCYPPDHEQILTVRVRNNAPLTFPFLNPFYTLRVTIEADNAAFAYFIGLGGKKRNFTDWYCDIGRIDSGSFDEVDIHLHADEGNLSLKVNVYLSFWVKIGAASATYLIEYAGDHKYNQTRLG